MSVKFTEEGHSYQSIDPTNPIDWISVTTLVSAFKKPFDVIKRSEKSSKNERSKWYGLSPERIREIWKSESTRASEMGSMYHKQRDMDLNEVTTIHREGIALPIVPSIWNHDTKIAPPQRLLDGIYPEHFMYLDSAGICGQADKVEILKSTVNISDYKTNKTINTNSFVNWEGIPQMMLPPVDHLEDCHIVHYSLQMSLYLYMILKHNPHMSAGKLTLDHILFKKEDEDQYGYPIYEKDDQGNFIVERIVNYDVQYMKTEVLSIMDYLKNNREEIKSKGKK